MALKTTVGYWETFPLLGQERWQKIPLETEIELGIDLSTATDEEIEQAMLKIRKVQYALRKQVQSFFFEANKAADKQAAEVNDIKVGKGTIEEQIEACTEIPPPGLKSLELIASMNPKLKAVYDKKFLELSNK